MLQQLNARAVRVSVTPNIDILKLSRAKTQQEIKKLLESDGGEAWRNSIVTLGKRARELNLEVHVVFYSVPAPWRIDRPRAGQPSRIDRIADPSRDQLLSDWIAANLRYVEDLGLQVSFVEIANEPDGTWNTHFSPEEYADLLKKTVASLKNAGLRDLRIEGPGCSELGIDAEYLTVLKQRGEMLLLAAVSGHDYMIEGPTFLGARLLEDSLFKLELRRPVHVTEFSDGNDRWGSKDFKTLPKHRGPDNGSDSLDFGLNVAAEGLRLISDGASETFLWELQDESWEGQSFGLIDLNGHPRPIFGAVLSTLGQLPPNGLAAGHKFYEAVFVVDKSASQLVLSGVNANETKIGASFQIDYATFLGNRMKIIAFPEGRSISVAVNASRSEIAINVPPRTAFSILWSL